MTKFGKCETCNYTGVIKEDGDFTNCKDCEMGELTALVYQPTCILCNDTGIVGCDDNAHICWCEAGADYCVDEHDESLYDNEYQE